MGGYVGRCGLSVTPVSDALVRVLDREPGLRLAVLFGSAARETTHAGSDVDVGVAGIPVSRLAALESALSRAVGRPVDLVDLTTAPPLLRFEIARDGRRDIGSTFGHHTHVKVRRGPNGGAPDAAEGTPGVPETCDNLQ